MSERSAALLLVLVLLVATLPAATSTAALNQYVEDFTTKTYCDTVNTTANWDTLAGEVRLHPFEITLAGSYDTPGSANGVSIAGDYAYVADGLSGLQVVDISDPTNPVSAGSYDTPDYAYDVAIAGDCAYVADRSSGLQVVDISDPTDPVSAGSYDTAGWACDVAIAGDYAYVTDMSSGLQVVDISDPTNPVSAGSYDTPGCAWGVAIAGDYAYVADDLSGLQVIDISDPTNPVLAGSYDTPSEARDVAIAGNYAYVADYSSGLQVVDISDPTNPVSAGSYDTPGCAWGVAIAGDHAYVADDYVGGLQVVDISDPTNPASAGSYDIPGTPRGVAIAGNYAYVADYNAGLRVVDVSDPTSVAFAGRCTVPAHARGVAITGDCACVATGDYGLTLVNISDPTSPLPWGFCVTPGYAEGVAIAGDYAYVADSDAGLQVVDISNLWSPSIAGSYDTPGTAHDVTIAGDYAYVADRDAGLQVVDISDPTNPVSAGSCDTRASAYDVVIAGDYAYVAVDDWGVDVVDISDPTSPVPAGYYTTLDSFIRGIVVSGDYAYVTDHGLYGLQVLDISDPTSPSYVTGRSTPGYACGVALSGNYAYVADGVGGLQAFDISDPTSLVSAGGYDTPGVALSVAISGDHAYVADHYGDLQVLEVFQRDLNLNSNMGQSLDVELSDYDVIRAKLSTTQADSILWELSADDGAHWEEVLPGGGWQAFAYPGSQLLWRSTLEYTGEQVNPTCTDLTIDWLYEFPLIDSVVDIPGDQGQQVRVSWGRSGYDFVGSSTPITEYAIYRRIDEASASASESTHPEFVTRESRLTPADPGQSTLYPPGSWDFIATVPAYAEEEYAVVVPTLADSTIAGGIHYSVFFIRAATAGAGVYFDAPPDSGYSVDNLAPAVPRGLAVDYSESENELAWEESEDEDFQYFRVYRGTVPEFVPDPENLVHMTIDIGWTDSVTEGWQYHYKVSAVDFSGNESDAASPEAVTGLDEPGAPGRYALYQNAPNPLNPTTVIRYDVPSGGGSVTLEIFDVSGRLVRRLLDGQEASGRKSVVWDGKDERGARVGSGVYYCRLVAPGYKKTLKMIVVK